MVLFTANWLRLEASKGESYHRRTELSQCRLLKTLGWEPGVKTEQKPVCLRRIYFQQPLFHNGEALPATWGTAGRRGESKRKLGFVPIAALVILFERDSAASRVEDKHLWGSTGTAGIRGDIATSLCCALCQVLLLCEMKTVTQVLS